MHTIIQFSIYRSVSITWKKWLVCDTFSHYSVERLNYSFRMMDFSHLARREPLRPSFTVVSLACMQVAALQAEKKKYASFSLNNVWNDSSVTAKLQGTQAPRRPPAPPWFTLTCTHPIIPVTLCSTTRSGT